jgi:hypothetical protein
LEASPNDLTHKVSCEQVHRGTVAKEAFQPVFIEF